MATGCILVQVLVVGKAKLYDVGWWSACSPQEIPDAIKRAVSTFSFYLFDGENPKVLATRTEITYKLVESFTEIANETNLAMGYPELGIRGRVSLETVKDTTAYMVLMK